MSTRNPDTREALIIAATAELAEHGLDASLDAICARAGFTRGAFYVHFGDRDALLVAVIDRELSRFRDALLPEGRGDLQTAILQFVALAAGDGVTTGTPAWRLHHTLDACARVPALRARYAALQEQAIARIRRRRRPRISARARCAATSTRARSASCSCCCR